MPVGEDNDSCQPSERTSYPSKPHTNPRLLSPQLCVQVPVGEERVAHANAKQIAQSHHNPLLFSGFMCALPVGEDWEAHPTTYTTYE